MRLGSASCTLYEQFQLTFLMCKRCKVYVALYIMQRLRIQIINPLLWFIWLQFFFIPFIKNLWIQRLVHVNRSPSNLNASIRKQPTVAFSTVIYTPVSSWGAIKPNMATKCFYYFMSALTIQSISLCGRINYIMVLLGRHIIKNLSTFWSHVDIKYTG